jgi:hypothetical protein
VPVDRGGPELSAVPTTRAAILGRPAAPAAFSPASPPGLLLWLWADQGTFQDAARTTPAAADGDPVGGWQDLSGRGNHASQAVAASRPTLRLGASGLSGRAALQLDGVNDCLQVAALDLSATPAVTAAAYFTANTGADVVVAELSDNYNLYADAFLFYRTSNNTGRIGGVGDVGRSQWETATTLGTSANSFVASLDKSLPTPETAGYVSGVLDGAEITSANNTNLLGSRPLNVGARNGASLFLNGKLRHLLVYGSRLSVADVARLDAWMRAN